MRARKLLKSKEVELHKLAAALLEQETLDDSEIKKIVGIQSTLFERYF